MEGSPCLVAMGKEVSPVATTHFSPLSSPALRLLLKTLAAAAGFLQIPVDSGRNRRRLLAA